MKTSHLFITAALASFSLPAVCAAEENESPNIVIIFIDDEGYGDVGVFGATGFETPNLDQMAGKGMRFTNFYSGCAVCSPSRAALLTGCYPPRIGVTKVLFPFDKIGLNQEETTIPEMLRKVGYKTGMVGKWHLGYQKEFLPLQHGFDEFLGLPYSNDMWPVHYNGEPVTKDNMAKQWKLNCPPLPLIDGNEPIEYITTLSDMDQLTTRYTERAVDFIKRNKENPFFLYLPHTMAHVPLGVSDKFKGKSAQGMYGDVMMEVDWSVGEVLKTLKECGIEKNTLVIFTTDNGPWINYGNHAGSAGGLREAKGSPFEGGFRVPCIMIWPDIIPAGTVCNQMAGSIDILPTIAAISNAPLPEKKIDGVNILSLLKADFEVNPRQEYYFYSGKSLTAVRYENYKLLFPRRMKTNVGSVVGKDGWPGTMPTVDFEGGMYDMIRDPGERYDLRETNPEMVEKLEKMASEMRKKLGDSSLKIRGTENRAPGMVSQD